jgi:D-alanine-D-alanine ligase
MRIALLYNLAENAPQPDPNAPHDVLYELDQPHNVEAYAAALRAGGHAVFPMEGNVAMAAQLKDLAIDLCYNTCEGYRGDAREAQVPALLEMLGVPYTGSKVMTLAVTLDKAMTKRVLTYHGLPTPAFQEFFSADDPIESRLADRFPLFAKPNSEGTGMGISEKSIVHTERELRDQVNYLIKSYRGSVIVEQYIEGADVTVGLVGNWPDLHIFPISMLDNELYEVTGVPVYGSALKVDQADAYKYHCPAPLPTELADELRRLTVETMRVTGTLDFARVDFRLDRRNERRPYILEINSLPGITPISDLTLMAQADGWTHADLVYSVLEAAMRRMGLQLNLPAKITRQEYSWVPVRPPMRSGQLTR